MILKEYIDLFPKGERYQLRLKIADEVGVSEAAVRSWANGNRKPSPLIVKSIVDARSIGGKVKASDLRPDIFKSDQAA